MWNREVLPTWPAGRTTGSERCQSASTSVLVGPGGQSASTSAWAGREHGQSASTSAWAGREHGQSHSVSQAITAGEQCHGDNADL